MVSDFENLHLANIRLVRARGGSSSLLRVTPHVAQLVLKARTAQPRPYTPFTRSKKRRRDSDYRIPSRMNCSTRRARQLPKRKPRQVASVGAFGMTKHWYGGNAVAYL